MSTVQNILKGVWEEEEDIVKHFKEGKIFFEKNLQALLFFYLKTKLDENYEVWAEPVIDELDN